VCGCVGVFGGEGAERLLPAHSLCTPPRTYARPRASTLLPVCSLPPLPLPCRCLQTVSVVIRAVNALRLGDARAYVRERLSAPGNEREAALIRAAFGADFPQQATVLPEATDAERAALEAGAPLPAGGPLAVATAATLAPVLARLATEPKRLARISPATGAIEWVAATRGELRKCAAELAVAASKPDVFAGLADALGTLARAAAQPALDAATAAVKADVQRLGSRHADTDAGDAALVAAAEPIVAAAVASLRRTLTAIPRLVATDAAFAPLRTAVETAGRSAAAALKEGRRTARAAKAAVAAAEAAKAAAAAAAAAELERRRAAHNAERERTRVQKHHGHRWHVSGVCVCVCVCVCVVVVVVGGAPAGVSTLGTGHWTRTHRRSHTHCHPILFLWPVPRRRP
jgi:hypothetical protein